MVLAKKLTIKLPKRREASIERAFVRALKGSIWWPIKLNLTGSRGLPDRLCLGPDRLHVYIEFKRPGEKLESSPRQVAVRTALAAFDNTVYVCETAQAALDALNREYRLRR